jgi:asparagine synthase (glutamine-hydrolysing)
VCGFAVLVDLRRETAADALEAQVGAMADSLRHRGPDDAGTWVDPEAGVALGFRRLAVLDLSPSGHQPMVSADGRHVLVFNGEIYNYRAVRRELEALGHCFVGTGDSEVLLAAISRWGVAGAAGRANGMFAFVVWDRERRTLAAARDRFGEKPLYVAHDGHRLLLASEVRALQAAGAAREVDPDAVALYLRLGYVPAPFAIHRRVAKVEPGTVRTIELGDRGGRDEVVAYWSAVDAVRAGASSRRRAGGDDLDELDELLGDSVRLRLVSDVPLGAFLSGGVDSSLVVSTMAAVHDRPVRTFTVGFEDAAYDESAHAAAVASHLGTDHHELVLTSADALAMVPKLASVHDEPFGDPSALPTSLIARFAREHVTVVLSGDGGDELFGGYDRYDWTQRLWSAFDRVPRPARAAGGRVLEAVPAALIDRLLDRLGRSPVAASRWSGQRIHRVAALAGADDASALYGSLVGHWPRSTELVPGSVALPSAVDELDDLPGDALVERLMLADTLGYLPDDILTKVDRASMAVSLEARVPLLDHRLFEWAWRQPLAARRAVGDAKRPLRALLARRVPPAVTERPKMGFGIPVGAWLRGPLRDWAADLLDPASLRAHGLHPEVVTARWRQHLDGRRDWAYPLWDVVMLQAWYETQPRA